MLARRRLLTLAGLAAASAVAPPLVAAADDYPSKPLRWVVPFPAGGSPDLIARQMGEWLTERLGQPVILEYKPGDGTNAGIKQVVHEPPDGYTLLLIVVTNAINPALYKVLPFDFLRDIAPVAGIMELPLVLDINPAVPARTVPEFIAYAKANPGRVKFASFGARSVGYLAVEQFKMAAGIDAEHVPYESPIQMMADLLGDVVQAAVDPVPGSLPYIRRGDLRALAALSAKRTAALPDVPTAAETLSGFEVTSWTAVGVPARTPAPIVERLNREINAGLADPAIMSRIAEVHAVPLVYTPADLRAFITHDIAKWAKVVEFARIEPE
jgi:tripartite-type tricarboxylate transporter receptor subunit TctC